VTVLPESSITVGPRVTSGIDPAGKNQGNRSRLMVQPTSQTLRRKDGQVDIKNFIKLVRAPHLNHALLVSASLRRLELIANEISEIAVPLRKYESEMIAPLSVETLNHQNAAILSWISTCSTTVTYLTGRESHLRNRRCL
jgi:hypothetical protein